MKVYIAVGHGRKPDGTNDPGATSATATEQNQGDPIVRAAAAALRKVPGVEVKHQTKGDPNFLGYTREANDWGADVAVSVHHDWSGAPRGAFGLWFPGSELGESLANELLDAVDAAGFPLRRNAHAARGNLHFLRRTTMPAVLWECDRVGQVRDHVGYGEALAAGILAWGAKHRGLETDVAPSAPAPKPSPAPAPAPARNTGWTETLVNNLPTLRRRGSLKNAKASERRLQGLLAAAGRLDIGANTSRGRFDGKFGPSTDRAVRSFQGSQGLTVDGIVGPKTWTALLGG